MKNPYVEAAARRLMGISVEFNPAPGHADDGSGRDEREAAKEGKAIGIANGRRVKFNRQIDNRQSSSRHVVSQ